MLKFNLILAVGSLCTAVGHCVTVLLTLTLHFRVRVRLTLTLGGFLINVGGGFTYTPTHIRIYLILEWCCAAPLAVMPGRAAPLGVVCTTRTLYKLISLHVLIRLHVDKPLLFSKADTYV